MNRLRTGKSIPTAFLPALIFGLLFSCSSPQPAEEDIYAVYSAAIEKLYIENENYSYIAEKYQGKDREKDGPLSPRLVVIVDQNNYRHEKWGKMLPETCYFKESFLLQKAKHYYYSLKDFPGIKLQTLFDYHEKNCEKNYPALKRKYNISRPYVIITPEKKSEIFKIRGVMPGWRHFYETYPESAGYIVFNQPGFDKEISQAYFLYEIGCGGLCGQGGIVYLVKKDGKWAVQKNVIVMVS